MFYGLNCTNILVSIHDNSSDFYGVASHTLEENFATVCGAAAADCLVSATAASLLARLLLVLGRGQEDLERGLGRRAPYSVLV